MALENAALRGVEVTLLLPRRSDHRLLDHTARSFFPELLAAGVRIFEFGPGMMHAKTAVVDGVWSTVGSANMDVRSFRLNFEANLVVHDRTLAGELTRLIERDLSEAVEVRAVDLRRRPLRLRLLDGAARILAPVL
jgi:cardiolipin synthase